MSVRRVVTGHDRDGKAIFVSDEQVDPVTVALRPDRAYHRLWGADQLPTFPDDGRPPEQHNYFPPVGGYRFGLFTVLPGTTSAPDGLDRQAALAETLPTGGRVPLSFLDPSRRLSDALPSPSIRRLQSLKSRLDPAGLLRGNVGIPD